VANYRVTVKFHQSGVRKQRTISVKARKITEALSFAKKQVKHAHAGANIYEIAARIEKLGGRTL
jgi:hypothetical protein